MEVTFRKVEHIYQKGTPFERRAIYDIECQISSGTFLAIIGHTGSGKSTLIEHMNGLLKPTTGQVIIGDFKLDASRKQKALKPLRRKVGIVFQYPEYQLFEETVEKDICFAPLNFGFSEQEAKQRTKQAIQQVGLPESILQKSPFELSGGQMRRVAIAGVLVMNPEVLILDEPTAGLDPRGKKQLMGLFEQLHKQLNLTTVLVTHSMEDAAQYADEIMVMDKGTINFTGTVKDFFNWEDAKLQEIGLDLPASLQFKRKLEQKFGCVLPFDAFTTDELISGLETFLSEEQCR